MEVVVFCPKCGHYLGVKRQCTCGWLRSRALPNSNTPIWYLDLGSQCRDRPFLCDGVLYLCDRDGWLHGLDAITGEQRFAPVSLGGVVRRPSSHSGSAMFVTLNDGVLVAYDIRQRRELWRASLSAHRLGASAPYRDHVYVGTAEAKLYQLAVRNGNREQAVLLDAEKYIGEAPAVSDSLFVVGDYAGYLYCIDVRYKIVKWKRKLEDRIAVGPVIHGHCAYVATVSGAIFQVDFDRRRRKMRRWSVQLDSSVCSELVVSEVGSILYAVTMRGTLYAVDTNRARVVWSQPSCSASTTPLLWHDLCFVGTKEGSVKAFDAVAGNLLKVWSVGESVPLLAGCTMMSLAFESGVLYAVTRKGGVLAFPWYLGDYEWAAKCASRWGDTAATAAFRSLAGDRANNSVSQRRHYDSAIDLWHDSELSRSLPEWEARFQEAHPLFYSSGDVADAYEAAAKSLALDDPQKSGEMLYRAVDICIRHDLWDKADKCHKQLSRMGMVPLLEIDLVNISHYAAGDTGQMSLVVRNVGDVPARSVSIRFGGRLTRVLKYAIPDIAPLSQRELTIDDLVPEGCLIKVDAFYETLNGRPLRTHQAFKLDLERSPIHVDGDVGLISAPLDSTVPQVRVRGDVGWIKLQPGVAPQKPGGMTPGSNQGDLAFVRSIEDVLVVPAGWLALLSVDGVDLDRVGPGHYSYQDLMADAPETECLAPKLSALCVRTGRFRMTFDVPPHPTQDGQLVTVRCLVDARLDCSRVSDFAAEAVGSRNSYSIQDLVAHLDGTVSNGVAAWLRGYSFDKLNTGLRQRQELAVALEAEMQTQLDHWGISLRDVAAVEYRTN